MARVLIIEDDVDAADVLSAILDNAGHIPLIAPYGPGVVRAASEDPPDVVLLDLAMPLANGLQILRLIKADARTAHVPVIVISSTNDPAFLEDASLKDAAMVIVKPWEPGQIESSVDGALAFRQPGRSGGRSGRTEPTEVYRRAGSRAPSVASGV